MKANVSMIMIVRNEPRLEQCILSFRDYVEELVIVDTGSTDDTTVAVAKKYADVFAVYTDCNDPETGVIDDFSNARNYAFGLATKEVAIWCDGDDTIVGAEKLADIIAAHTERPIQIMLPYDYAHDSLGNVVVTQYRERIVAPREAFRWTSPVHECLIIKSGTPTHYIVEEIKYVHNRHGKTTESGRNLRILEKEVARVGDTDPRQLYYYGLELFNNGFADAAITNLNRYLELSGWDDERVMARIRLAQHYLSTNEFNKVIDVSLRAIVDKEDWGEPYFSLAKACYHLAANGVDEQRNWQRCVHFANQGLSYPPSKTVLFINPNERDYEIHTYLNFALNKLGDVVGALQSVNTALAKIPGDPSLLMNKRMYETHLATMQFNAAKQKLDELGANVPAHKPAANPNCPFPVAGVVGDSNTWVIPDNFDTHGYPLVMTEPQLQAVVLMLWKEFINQDELLSATKFLENAPYRVRYSGATMQALQQTKAMYSWITDLSLVQKHNSPLDANDNVITYELGVPLPQPMGDDQQGDRFKFVAERLPAKSKIVDFGCFDGAYTNRYGLLGHDVVGLDLTETSVALANRKAAEFNTGAKHIVTHFNNALEHVEENSFDIASSTDTYEHLLDPVSEMLVPAHKMLKADGKFLMTTPHGQWFRGEYIPWAHPWITPAWLGPSPRGHLIAPGTWDVVANFRAAGFEVKDCYPKLSTRPDVPGQGNVIVEANATPRKLGLDIVFYIGPGVEAWNPESIKVTGIGGSETAACEMAKKLAALGHKVRVYADCRYEEGVYDFVEYRHFNLCHDLTCDVYIASRQAQALSDEMKITAKTKVLWVHDTFALNATPNLLLNADKILALSEWHKANLIETHNVPSEQVIVTRNGINLERFAKKVARNKFKCVNSSSPDRSWIVLLDTWKAIRVQVPQAELHLFYGFKNWEHSAKFQSGHPELIARLKQQIADLSSHGVVFHDRVSQDQLAEEFLSAGVVLYPTWFSETSCITMMEAQAAGLSMVTSNIAALKETVANRGVLLDGDWVSPAYKAAFVKAAVKALKNTTDTHRINLQQFARDHFSWDSLAKEWEAMFLGLIEKNKVDPGNPYVPARSWK